VRVPLWFVELLRPPVWGLARLLFRIRFIGVEHVPLAGAVVLVPNHVSYMDPVLLTIPVRRPLHYMTLEVFFGVPGLGAFIRWFRAFPVREDEIDRPAIRTAMRILRDGHALVVFPEGGRSRDGRLLPFRPGAFRLALQADAPVVPVTIAGAHAAWPAHRRLPRPGRITITFHAPLGRKDLPAAADRAAQAESMAALACQQIESALGYDRGASRTS
jgi:1-acyl-sn-glycerol-3-phosphate acyltransferase